MCYRSRLLINKFNTRGTGHELECISKLVEITQSKSHYAVQGHSSSPILVPIESSYTNSYIVINTNLPPILHRFQVTIKFLLARGECITSTLSLRVIPANIAASDVSQTGLFGLYFCCRKCRCIFYHLYVIRPESYRIR